MRVKNLAKLYMRGDRENGLLWYHRAHEFCKTLAQKHNLELAIVCGIVSALSPSCNWEQNKKDARRLVEGKRTGFVTYKRNVQKAIAILNRKIMPDQAFNPLTGAKTYNFFHNLLCPHCDHHVTIDRHAFRIATGEEYSRIHPALYERVANHYRKHAKKLGIRPLELQATLWVSYRKENNILQTENVPF
jgi:hypothetical protein